jgi:hypothetical protein
MSVVSDWTLSLLPVLLLKDVAMRTPLKVAVMLLLGLGFFASISSIIRFTSLPTLAHSSDYLVTPLPVIFWSGVEATAGIVAINVATFKPLFKSLMNNLSSIRDSNPRSGIIPSYKKSRNSRPIEVGYILSAKGNDVPSITSRRSGDFTENPLALKGLASPNSLEAGLILQEIEIDRPQKH